MNAFRWFAGRTIFQYCRFGNSVFLIILRKSKLRAAKSEKKKNYAERVLHSLKITIKVQTCIPGLLLPPPKKTKKPSKRFVRTAFKLLHFYYLSLFFKNSATFGASSFCDLLPTNTPICPPLKATSSLSLTLKWLVNVFEAAGGTK